MKKSKLSVAVLAIALFAAACGGGYDRDSAYDDLVSEEFGLSGEQADCVLDNVEDQGLEDAIIEDDIENVSAEDQEAVTDIIGECLLGDAFTEDVDDAVDSALENELDAETGE